MALHFKLKNCRRCNRAFTLVELLVVVVIIGILAAIAIPNFMGAQLKAKAAAVKGNMRTTQIAAESYNIDSGGVYPVDGPAYLPYTPGGSNSIGGNAGNYPTNPVTGVPNQPPVSAGPNSSVGIMLARATDAASVQVPPGQIVYRQCDNGDSYQVSGGDALGKAVAGIGGKVLMLSNQ